MKMKKILETLAAIIIYGIGAAFGVLCIVAMVPVVAVMIAVAVVLMLALLPVAVVVCIAISAKGAWQKTYLWAEQRITKLKGKTSKTI